MSYMGPRVWDLVPTLPKLQLWMKITISYNSKPKLKFGSWKTVLTDSPELTFHI